MARSRRGSFGLGLAARSDVAGRGGGATGSPPVRRRRTPAGVEGSVSHRAQPGRPLRGTRSTRHDAKAASLASIAAPHRGSNLGRRSPSQIHNDDETPPRPIAILTMAAATDSTNRDGVRPLRFGRRRGPRHRARGGDRRRRGWVDGVHRLRRGRPAQVPRSLLNSRQGDERAPTRPRLARRISWRRLIDRARSQRSPPFRSAPCTQNSVPKIPTRRSQAHSLLLDRRKERIGLRMRTRRLHRRPALP